MDDTTDLDDHVEVARGVCQHCGEVVVRYYYPDDASVYWLHNDAERYWPVACLNAPVATPIPTTVIASL